MSAHSIHLPVILASLLMCGLQGCFPLPQLEQQPSPISFQANYDAGDKYILFSVGPNNRPKAYEIVPERSYMLDPSGTRHPILVQTHAFDLSQHYPFIRDDVFVLRSAADPQPIRLHNGTWNLVLARRVADVERQDTFAFRLSTFYYSPLVHGPPN